MRIYVSLPTGERVLSPERLEAFDALTLSLAEHPAVADVSGPTRPFGTDGPQDGPSGAAARFVSPDGGAARLDVCPGGEPVLRRGPRRGA